MPYYDFQHSDGRVISIFQNMNDNHDFWKDEDGVKWNRLFSVPHAVVDSIFNVNPHDSKEFVNVTGKKKGNIGDLFQLSAELSEKRASKVGIDTLKQKSFENYEKSRSKGSIHPEQAKQKMKENIKRLGANIQF